MEESNEFTSLYISRNRFLKLVLWTSSLGVLGISCRGIPEEIKLKGITAQEYENIKIFGDFFLDGFEIDDFNIGLALDDFLYGSANPHPLTDRILELVSIPSSYLASLYIDHSPVPLVHLDDEERKKRLLSWRNSRKALSGGIYSLLHTLCMTLVSADPSYQKYVGYLP